MWDRQTPSTCANALKTAGVVSEEGPGFGPEANEASAQQLQGQGLLPTPHSSAAPPVPRTPRSQNTPSADREATVLSPGQQTPETPETPTARTSFEIPFVAVIPILLPQPTHDHKLTTHHSPMEHTPPPPRHVSRHTSSGNSTNTLFSVASLASSMVPRQCLLIDSQNVTFLWQQRQRWSGCLPSG